jgi:hypothetical protein
MYKICIFGSEVKKGELKSAEGNGRPSKQATWSEAKFVVKNAIKTHTYHLTPMC